MATPEEIKKKRKRQTNTYLFYLNKDWKKKFKKGDEDEKEKPV